MADIVIAVAEGRLNYNDIFWDNVVLAVQMDGVNGASAFTDVSSAKHTLISYGATTDTSVKQFGTASAYFNGNSRIGTADSTDFNFGNGDFTIECWIDFSATTGLPSWMDIIGQRTTNSSNVSFELFYTNSSSTVAFNVSTTGGASNYGVSKTITPKVGTFQHIAVVRFGNTLGIAVDGVMNTSSSIGTNAIYDSSAELSIGAVETTSAYMWRGHIDDVRITKGVARYTSNFTAPVYGFPVSAASNNPTILISTGTISKGSVAFNGQPIDVGINSNFVYAYGSVLGRATAVTFAGQTPSITQSITTTAPAVDALSITSYAPWVGINQNLVMPPEGSLGVTSYSASNNLTAYVGTRVLSTGMGYPTTSKLIITADSSLIDESIYKHTISGGTRNTSVTVGGSAGSFTGQATVTPISDINISTGDWTFEAWVYPTASAAWCTLLGFNNSTGGPNIYLSNSKLMIYGFGTNYTHTANVPLNTWTHVAVTRTGTTYVLYVNGVGESAPTQGASVTFGTLTIGRSTTGSAEVYSGYIDNLAIHQIVRFTGNFSPSYTLPIAGSIPTSVVTAGDAPVVSPIYSPTAVSWSGNNPNAAIGNVYSVSVGSMSFGGKVPIVFQNSFNKSLTDLSTTQPSIGVSTNLLSSLSSGNGATLSTNFTLGSTVSYSTLQVSPTNTNLTYSFTNKLPTITGQAQLGHYRWTDTKQLGFTGQPGIVILTAYRFIFDNATTVSYTTYAPDSLVRGYLAWPAVKAMTSTGQIPTIGISYKFDISPGALSSQGYEFFFSSEGSAPLAPSANLTITGGSVFLDISYTISVAEGGLSLSGDPYWNNVVLAMHMDGADNGTTFTDLKGHTFTQSGTGNVVTKTAVSKFGAASAYFSGPSSAGPYLTTPTDSNLAFGTSDFTIEFWYNPSFDVTSGTAKGTSIQVSSLLLTWDNVYKSLNASVIGSGYTVRPTGGFVTGTWTHVVYQRSGTSATMYYNGVNVGTGTDSTNYSTTYNTYIGSRSDLTNEIFYGYIDDIRITKGVARYTSNFTAPTAAFIDRNNLTPTIQATNYSEAIPTQIALTGQTPIASIGYTFLPANDVLQAAGTDPYWNNVVLAMHMDGANNGTTFTDLTGKTATRVGSVVTSTTQSKFGGASLYTNSKSNYLSFASSADFDFSSADVTIEFWLYMNALPATTKYVRALGFGTNGTTASWQCWIDESGTIGFGRETGGALPVYANIAITANTWHHVAVVLKSGSNHKIFINGTDLTYSATTERPTSGNCAAYIGGEPAVVGVADFVPLNGYLDDVIITKGVARYTSNFTVPTKTFVGFDNSPTLYTAYNFPVPSYQVNVSGVASTQSQNIILSPGTGSLLIDKGDPYWSNVRFLAHFDGNEGGTVFTDEVGHPITKYGSITTQAAQSVFGSSGIYVNGGNRLKTDATTDFSIGTTDDFTIEFWLVNPNTIYNTIALAYEDGNLNGWRIGWGNQYLTFYRGSPIVQAWTNWGATSTHIAVNRSGGTLSLFSNGTRISQTTDNSAFSNTAQLVIGDGYVGGIDEVRITIGVARYGNGASITVPNAAFSSPPRAVVITPNIVTPNAYNANITGASTSINVNVQYYFYPNVDSISLSSQPPAVLNGTVNTVGVVNTIPSFDAPTVVTDYTYVEPVSTTTGSYTIPSFDAPTVVTDYTYVEPVSTTTGSYTIPSFDAPSLSVVVNNSSSFTIQSAYTSYGIIGYVPAISIVQTQAVVDLQSGNVTIVGAAPDVGINYASYIIDGALQLVGQSSSITIGIGDVDALIDINSDNVSVIGQMPSLTINSSFYPKQADIGFGTVVNYISNSTQQDVVTGTPGVLPVGWASSGNTAGLTQQIVGTGTDGGMPYIDIRWSGVLTAQNTFKVWPEHFVNLPAKSGQDWVAKGWVVLTNVGTAPNTTYFGIYERNTSNSIVQSTTTTIATSGAVSSNPVTIQRTLTDATTVYVDMEYGVQCLNVGSSYDFTIRIAGSMLQRGTVASTYYPTSGTKTRISNETPSLLPAALFSFYNQPTYTVGQNEFLFAPYIWVNTASTALVGTIPTISQNQSFDIVIAVDAGSNIVVGQTNSTSINSILLPAAGTSTLSGQNPTTNISAVITVNQVETAFTGYAPVIPQQWFINPNTGAISLAGYSNDFAINYLDDLPTTVNLSLTGTISTVSVGENISPTTNSVSATGTISTLSVSINQLPGRGTSTLAGQIPSVIEYKVFSPDVASVNIAGQNVFAGGIIPTATLSVAGQAPSVGVSYVFSPDVAALAFTGTISSFASTIYANNGNLTTLGAQSVISYGHNTIVSNVEIQTTGQATILSYGHNTTPNDGNVTLFGQIPAPNTNIILTTLVGSMVVSGQTPIASYGWNIPVTQNNVAIADGTNSILVDNIFTPSTKSAVVTGVAPSLNYFYVISPNVGSMNFAGTLPISNNAIPEAFVSITGQAPNVGVSYVFTPNVGSSTIASQTPLNVEYKIISTEIQQLQLVGFQPSVLSNRVYDINSDVIEIAGTIPKLNVNFNFLPNSNNTNFTGYVSSSSISYSNNIISPASISFIGYSPQIRINRVFAPLQANTQLSSNVITTSVGVNTEISSDVISVEGGAVNLYTQHIFKPSTKQLFIVGDAIVNSTKKDISVETFSAIALGQIPTVSISSSFNIPYNNWIITGLSPSLYVNHSIKPSTGSSQLTGLSNVKSVNLKIDVVCGSISYFGAAPVRLTGSSLHIEIQTGSVNLSGNESLFNISHNGYIVKIVKYDINFAYQIKDTTVKFIDRETTLKCERKKL